DRANSQNGHDKRKTPSFYYKQRLSCSDIADQGCRRHACSVEGTHSRQDKRQYESKAKHQAEFDRARPQTDSEKPLMQNVFYHCGIFFDAREISRKWRAELAV